MGHGRKTLHSSFLHVVHSKQNILAYDHTVMHTHTHIYACSDCSLCPQFSDESVDNLVIVMMVCIGIALLIVVIATVAVTYYCVWWGRKRQRNTTG